MLPSVTELAPSSSLPSPVETRPGAMPSVSNVIEFPLRHDGDVDSLEHDMVLEVATSDDVASGLARVVQRVRRHSGAARVEWWATGDDGVLELVAGEGRAHGRRESLPLGSVGVIAFFGGLIEPEIESALMSLTPIIRRRAAEERLARKTIQLARRNEALEDFAALVAHELKTPLHAALVADDPSGLVEEALDLVETLLESAQSESGERTFTSAAESLALAADDLHAEVEITSDLGTTLPLPPEPLRVILRNLLSNAVAAGAKHVHVAAVSAPGSWRLLVDDDGAGLGDVDSYGAGSGIGLSLSRRIANRFGGALGLAPRHSGGTRATLEFAGAPK
jgi:signal transduction histidine kinase